VVEAGNALSGTRRAPQVRLTPNPPLPQAQVLSWLVVGRDLKDAGGADLALLQAATSSLLETDGERPPGGRIADGLGLDEVGLRGRVLAFGKRLSDRICVEYEQGLAAASSVVRLSRELTRTLSLRTEAGAEGGRIGIRYRRMFE
jgi:translocation and assembly module TamB